MPALSISPHETVKPVYDRAGEKDSVRFMWKLLTLLGAGMFLVLLIGGRDQGQVRQGLMAAPEAAPEVAAAAFDPEKIVPDEPAIELATFVPVAAPAPAQSAPELPAFAAEVAAAVPAPAETPPVEPAAAEPAAEVSPPLPVRWIKAGSVNLRDGPSTSNAVIGRLTRNEAVSVVGDAGDGWVLVRLEGDGGEGYVAARLLTDVDPTP